MKSYNSKDICCALHDFGIGKGDTILLLVSMHTVGRLEGCSSNESYNNAYFEAFFDVIGSQGTLIALTYSQQVGRFGIPYIHEETPTLCGAFSEFIRTYPGAIRSFHPVFSLSALGSNAQKICGNVGTNGFGAQSAYDHLFKQGGYSLCLGFNNEFEGKAVPAVHYIESTYGVPYYYNKILKADVYKDGRQCNKIFTLNVRYTDFDTKHNFTKFIEVLRTKRLLHTCPIGDSILYSSKLKDQLMVGYELLSEDVYAFLEYPPNWRKGEIPFEGPPEKMEPERAKNVNWKGFYLKFRR